MAANSANSKNVFSAKRTSVIHNTQYIEFVAQLRRARRAKGLTQEDLGIRLKRPQAFVSKVETCERRLDLIEAIQWCMALGVYLEDVLPGELHTGLFRVKKAIPRKPEISHG